MKTILLAIVLVCATFLAMPAAALTITNMVGHVDPSVMGTDTPAGIMDEIRGDVVIIRGSEVIDARVRMEVRWSDIVWARGEESLAGVYVTELDHVFREQGPSGFIDMTGTLTPGNLPAVAEETPAATGAWTIGYLQGRGFVQRGTKVLPATQGMVLQPGDSVSAGEGSQVTVVSPDGELVKVTERTRFVIPEQEAPAGPLQAVVDGITGVFDSIWNGLNNLIRGESFEIKTPAAGTGSRG
ncbi:MAG: hypothetical protein ACP5C4_04475 [Methanomicrobiales archaeon]